MHADKVFPARNATFIPPTRNTLAARLQDKQLQSKQEFRNNGDLSPLLARRRWSAMPLPEIQTKKETGTEDLQGKESSGQQSKETGSEQTAKLQTKPSVSQSQLQGKPASQQSNTVAQGSASDLLEELLAPVGSSCPSESVQQIGRQFFPLPSGSFSYQAAAISNHPHPKYPTTNVGGLSVRLEFIPESTVPNTQNIQITQIAKTTRNGQDFQWSNSDSRETERDLVQTAASDISHTVTSGDTLESLAAQYYGDTTRYSDILSANADILPTQPDPTTVLTPGTSVLIPNAVLGGYFVDHLYHLDEPRANSNSPQISQNYVTSDETGQHGSNIAGQNPVLARLIDQPLTDDPLTFTFETVARDVDNGIYYGSMFWGFDVDSCLQTTVTTPTVIPGVTETFFQSLVEYNSHYRNDHIVVAGETLGVLARRYGVDWQSIKTANASVLPDNLAEDTEIRPAGSPEILLLIPGVSADP